MNSGKTLDDVVAEAKARQTGPPINLTRPEPAPAHSFELFSVHGFKGSRADAVKRISDHPKMSAAAKAFLIEQLPEDAAAVEIHLHAHRHGNKTGGHWDVVKLF